jgi:hypothetical protein
VAVQNVTRYLQSSHVRCHSASLTMPGFVNGVRPVPKTNLIQIVGGSNSDLRRETVLLLITRTF